MAGLPEKKRVGARALVGVVVLVVIAAACSGGGKKAAKPAVAAATTTTTTNPKVVPVAPLTGLPDPKDQARSRSAVTVKINNTIAAVQSGVDQADVVYEEVVEGGITRLAAIFNSHAPDKVGPVRSVRKTDQSIVWPIGGIFAYSGGAQYAIDSIDTAPVKQLDETRAGSMMYRDPLPNSVYAPFNLWAHVDQMYTAGGKPVPPPPLFVYRKPNAKVGGTPVGAFSVGFTGGFAPLYTWDAKSGSWLRTAGSSGASATDSEGVHYAPKNVVVMFVQYIGGAGVEQSEANLIGSGNAWIFTGGKVIKGHWTRPDKAKPAKLTDSKGGVVRLAPGQTWVELPDVSYTVTVLPPAPASAQTAK
jgi:hypothetical protein